MDLDSFANLRIKHLEELLEIKYEMLSEFEKELAITSSPAQKFELRQRLKREVLPDLRKHEVEYAQLLARRTDPASIPPQEAEAVLAEVQHAVEHIAQLPAAPPDEVKQLLTDVRKKLDEPGKSAAAKLKVTLPLIPLIVSYEMELDTEGFLTQAWRGLKSLFGSRGSVSADQKDALISVSRPMGDLDDRSLRDALRGADWKHCLDALGEIRRRDPGAFLMEILTCLRRDHPDIRREAGATLVAIGKPAVPGLLVALKEKSDNRTSWMVRCEAAERLGDIRDPKAENAIIEALDDEMSNVRWAAAMSSGKIGGKGFVVPLMQSLKSDAHASVREEAARSLGIIGDTLAISHLIAALSDTQIGPGSSRRVCDAAIDALARFESDEAKSAVEQWRRRLLGDSSSQ